MYEYRARLIKVVDGDTFDVLIDVGFRISINERVRVYGVDTPERGEAKAAAATKFTHNFCTADATEDEWPLIIRTAKPHDKYGRWLANVERNGESLADALVKAKLAKQYFGGTKA